MNPPDPNPHDANPSEEITSLQNPRIKDAVRLMERRARNQTGLTRIDGARELLRAVGAEVIPETLFVCEELVRDGEGRDALDACRDAGVEIQPVIRSVSEKLAFGDRREGLCAIVSWQPRPLSELELSESPLLFVVNAVEKPGNLGALLRTADAAGVDALVVCDAVTDLANPNTIRASMGTVFTVPVAQAEESEARSFLQDRGIAICTTRPEATTLYWEHDLTVATALVLGSEKTGLGPAWNDAGMTALRLPMAGAADSLNVNVSAAIVAFEARRQRGG